MPGKELLTRAEVMEYLRISRGTLDRLIKEHAMPYIKLEQKVLFRMRDVDAWLDKRTVPALHPPPKQRRRKS